LSNVHFLSDKPAEYGEPNQALIEMLEGMLDKARTGELQTLLGVGHTSDGGIVTIFTSAALLDYFLHLGAIEGLKAEFIKRQEER
jgi:hypothetical protein